MLSASHVADIDDTWFDDSSGCYFCLGRCLTKGSVAGRRTLSEKPANGFTCYHYVHPGYGPNILMVAHIGAIPFALLLGRTIMAAMANIRRSRYSILEEAFNLKPDPTPCLPRFRT